MLTRDKHIDVKKMKMSGVSFVIQAVSIESIKTKHWQLCVASNSMLVSLSSTHCPYMHLLSIGINHHTAPVALRERVAFPLEQIRPALQMLKAAWRGRNSARGGAAQPVSATGRLASGDALSEAAILSTCNRTEIYCATDDRAAPEHAIAWLSAYHGVPADELAPHVYALPQLEAVRHAMRVASGLDSMALGETQILGQMKDAVRTASEAGAMGTYLNQMFQRTFSVAKEVRSQTDIGAHSISMAAAAVRLAQRIFDKIANQRVLLIGAGEMIELCATHFCGTGAARAGGR